MRLLIFLSFFTEFPIRVYGIPEVTLLMTCELQTVLLCFERERDRNRKCQSDQFEPVIDGLEDKPGKASLITVHEVDRLGNTDWQVS